MAGPIITKIRDWLYPKKDDPKPTPAPTPQPEPVDDKPLIAPSSIQFVNYIRAIMILRNIPITKLQAEFAKIPWLDIGYIAGVFIWVYMTYALTTQLFRAILF
jgi:hypothetical protein